jgi:Protein of unknown function (DUF429)
LQVVAVDWSGRAHGERRAIWVAEARDGEILRLEDGRSRDEVADHVLGLAATDSQLVVGMDFSFSLPEWFLDACGFATVADLWAAAERDGERWLHDCKPPFWGRPGAPRPTLPAHLRVTETEAPTHGGVRPKSSFQVGGAGSVGTGSIRGFPVLARLRSAGVSIWPFDPGRLPCVVEVYPRACTGAVVKSRHDARARFLDARYPQLAASRRERAVASEDAFDALVTALVMAEHASQLACLEPPDHPAAAREGWMWCPRDAAEVRAAP